MEIKHPTTYIQSKCSAIELFHSPQNSIWAIVDELLNIFHLSGHVLTLLFFFLHLTPHNSFIDVVFGNLTFYVRHTPQLY